MADKQIYRFTNDIDTVEVSSIGAKIIMKLHDKEEIYAEYDNPRDIPEFCAVLNGKTLTLKENISLHIGLLGRRAADNYTITVYLPAVNYSKIKVSTAGGGADISGVSAESFELGTASGSINIDAFFENVKIQSASGSVTLSNPTEKTAKTLSVRTVSGNAVITGYKTEQFSIHSISGKTRYDSASGEGSIAVTSGSVEVTYADWTADLSVSIISGSVAVYLPDNAGMELKFDAVSGMLKTDLGNEKGSFMNLGKGTSGEFGGDNRHKLSVSLTSGNITVAQDGQPEEVLSEEKIDA